MKITDTIHAIRHPFRLLLGEGRYVERFVYSYLIAGKTICLVDAGVAATAPLILDTIKELGRSPREIALILLTHAHPDHIGGVREIAAMTGAQVLMHEADVVRLRIGMREALRELRPSAFVAALTRGPEDAKPLDDGAVLPGLGGLEVVHTPGHTPGSVCLHVPAHRLLIVGDVLQVLRGQVALPSYVFTEDMALARRSIARLAELDIDTICFAHYPTLRHGGREALRALAERARSGSAATSKT